MIRALIFLFLFSFIGFSCGSDPQNRKCSDKSDCLAGEFCLNDKCDTVECKKNGDCTGNTVCLDGKCQNTNNSSNNNSNSCNECKENEKRCSSNQTQVCLKLSSGCLQWSAPKNCPLRQTCQNGDCVTACQDSCPRERASECAGASSYKVCKRNAQGCLQWGKVDSCSAGNSCQNGSCKKIKASEGQRCNSTNDCNSGLVCSGTTDNNYSCKRRCGFSSDCSAGQYCYDLQGGGGACFIGIGNGAPRDFVYKIKIISAKVTERHPTEGCWDYAPTCNSSDLTTKVDIDGGSFRTYSGSDSTSANWDHTSANDYTASQIAGMIVTLEDDDPTKYEYIASWKGFKIINATGASWDLSESSSGVISLKIQVVGRVKR